MKKQNSIILVLAKNVRFYRLKSNLSQEKLAELAGLHRTYIGMVERGERNITVNNLGKIARALNLAPSKLLEDVNE